MTAQWGHRNWHSQVQHSAPSHTHNLCATGQYAVSRPQPNASSTRRGKSVGTTGRFAQGTCVSEARQQHHARRICSAATCMVLLVHAALRAMYVYRCWSLWGAPCRRTCAGVMAYIILRPDTCFCPGAPQVAFCTLTESPGHQESVAFFRFFSTADLLNQPDFTVATQFW